MSYLNRLAVLGAGGHGRVIADTAQLGGGWSEIVFFDDSYDSVRKDRLYQYGWKFSGSITRYFENPGDFEGVIVGIGDNVVRLALHKKLVRIGVRVVSIHHPSAIVSPRASIGCGSVVVAGSVVNVGCAVGEACIINTGATVDHDCIVGAGTHVSPGVSLAGGVRIGECSWIGIGACSRQDVSIGARCMIGAGSVVVSDIPSGSTVVGNPARRVPESESGGGSVEKLGVAVTQAVV